MASSRLSRSVVALAGSAITSVYAGIAGDGTELVEELAFRTFAGMRVAPRQVVPTRLLHPLIVIAFGRKRYEANTTSRVGKILRQRYGTSRNTDVL